MHSRWEYQHPSWHEIDVPVKFHLLDWSGKAPADPTCIQAGSNTIVDHFVMDTFLTHLFERVRNVQDMPLSPQDVELLLKARTSDIKVRDAKKYQQYSRGAE